MLATVSSVAPLGRASESVPTEDVMCGGVALVCATYRRNADEYVRDWRRWDGIVTPSEEDRRAAVTVRIILKLNKWFTINSSFSL